MKFLKLRATFILTIVGLSLFLAQDTANAEVDNSAPIETVAIIAPSVSTSMMARKILSLKKWHEARPKKADAILVVVRSSLFDPLNFSYENFGDLRRDAEMQLNIAGPKYHIYIFRLDDELRCSIIDHNSFDAND